MLVTKLGSMVSKLEMQIASFQALLRTQSTATLLVIASRD